MIGSRAIFLACMMLVAHPAYAVSKKEQLQQTEEQQKSAEEKAKALLEQRGKIEQDQIEIKRALVDMTRNLQVQEKKLAQAELDLSNIQKNVKAREADMEVRKTELQAMMTAAVRLSQVPPEAGLMMPEFSNQTVEAATALKMMTQSIQDKTKALKVEMQALKKDQSRAEALRSQAEKQKRVVLADRASLEKSLNDKERLLKQVDGEQREQARMAEELAQKSSNLKQLVEALEKALTEKKPDEEKKSAAAQKTVEGVANTGGSKGKMRSFSSAKGRIRPPSSGKVIAAYNQGKNDEHSKGVTIQTTARATVSAPYDGEVVFTGNFRKYGNLVILKHSDDFHTLIAGLDDIRVKDGEKLLEGEPLGSMGERSSERDLYVELRKHNQPINPSSYFVGL